MASANDNSFFTVINTTYSAITSFPGTEEGEEKKHLVYIVRACA